jgi:probable rRNA maturation factor
MIVNRQRSVRLERRPLEIFLGRVRKELGLAKAEVTVCLVSDAEMARLNEKFRGKKGTTDVLSFPSEGKWPLANNARGKRVASGERRARYLGDIAIAPLTARRYAKKNARSLRDEMRVLTLHGVLHLLGYDHETDRGQMDRMEMKMRKRFGLA